MKKRLLTEKQLSSAATVEERTAIEPIIETCSALHTRRSKHSFIFVKAVAIRASLILSTDQGMLAGGVSMRSRGQPSGPRCQR